MHDECTTRMQYPVWWMYHFDDPCANLGWMSTVARLLFNLRLLWIYLSLCSIAQRLRSTAVFNGLAVLNGYAQWPCSRRCSRDDARQLTNVFLPDGRLADGSMVNVLRWGEE